ncbi:MAG: glycosyltransferase family 39 protein [Acidobacteriota bacterium]
MVSASRLAFALTLAVAAVGLYPSSTRWSAIQTATLALLAVAAWLVNKAPGPFARFAAGPSRAAVRLWSSIEAVPDGRFALGLAAVQLTLTASFSWGVLGAVPHVEDEAAQLFHAGVLLETGSVTAPPPPLANEFFEMSMTLMEPQWYSQYPPLHVLLLTVGRALGSPWLVNPFLAGLTAMALFFAALEMFGAATARVTGLLFLASPAVLIMSSSFMNHVPALLFTALFVLFFARAWRTRRPIDGLLAGFAIGAVFLVRPLTAIGVSAPFIVVAAAQLFSPVRRRAVLAMAAGGLAGVAALLWWNQATNDSPLTMGYIMRTGSMHTLGFGPRLEGEFTPLEGLLSVATNLQRINYALLYWPVPLLAVAALAQWRQPAVFSRLLAASALSLVGLHGFYFSNLWIYGPRSVYSGLAGLLPLVALGLVELIRRVQSFAEPRRAAGFALALPVLAGCLASSVLQIVQSADELKEYRGVTRSLSRVAIDAELENALLFVPHATYRNFSWRNHPLLEGDVVYARNRGDLNRQLVEQLSQRQTFILCGERIVPWTEELEALPDDCPKSHRVGDSREYGRVDRAERRARALGSFTEASPTGVRVESGRDGE